MLSVHLGMLCTAIDNIVFLCKGTDEKVLVDLQAFTLVIGRVH